MTRRRPSVAPIAAVRLVAASGLMVVLAGGCTVAEEAGSVPVIEGLAEDERVAAEFLRLLGSGDVADIARAERLAAPDSPAAAVVAMSEAESRYYPTVPTATVEVRDGAAVNCFPAPERRCYPILDVVVDDEGRLVDFRVRGAAVGERFRLGAAPAVTGDGVAGRVLVAVEAVGGALCVAVELAVDGPAEAELIGRSARYTGARGDDRALWSPSDDRTATADEPAVVIYQFEGSRLGGTISVVARVPDEGGGPDRMVRLDLPVPA